MDNQRYLRNVSTLEYDSSKCVGCNMCVEVCPHHVFRLTNKRAEITDRDKCMECGACALNCKTGAIQVNQGVGCATAVIWGFLKGTEPSCDCGGGSSSGSGAACC